MEGFAKSTAEALHAQPVVLVEMGKHENLFIKADNHNHEHGADHDHGDLDPHIGLDPLRMILMGEIVLDTLIDLKPEDEDYFDKNFTTFKEEMTALDESFEEVLSLKSKKQIIVTHAAYGYWEERYGIEQISISGLSSSQEPSQKELAAIAKRADEEQLKYVIFEQNGSNNVATIIQEHIGAKKLTIHNLETLTDEDVANNEDYFSLMRENLEVLDEATQ